MGLVREVKILGAVGSPDGKTLHNNVTLQSY